MPVVTSYTSVGTVTLQNVPSPPPADNALATAAAALIAGSGATSYASFAIPTYGALSGLSGDGLDWNTRITWDSVRLKAHLIWKAANKDGEFKYVQYDAATNVWTKLHDGPIAAGGASESGHAYDNHTIDEVDGTFYYQPLGSENTVKWNGSAWEACTGNVTGGTGQASTPRQSTLHPNLYGTGDPGLVTARGSSQVRAWRKSSGPSGSWNVIGSMVTVSTDHSQAVYSPALDSLIITSGVTDTNVVRVASGPTVTTSVQNLPVKCSANATASDTNMSRLVRTPSGTVAIFESASPYRVWRLNTSTLLWELQSYTHPLRNINSSWPTAYVSNYGIYMALRESVSDGSAIPSCRLWRPPAGL